MTKSDIDWKFRFGEFSMVDEKRGVLYNIELGYMRSAPDLLYVRLWLGDEFKGGTWVKDLYYGNTRTLDMPHDMLPICIETAHRVEKLKIFA